GGVHDRLVPAGREDRAYGRLADIAAEMAAAMLGQQLVEREDAFDANDAVQLLTGIGEMLAEARVHRDAAACQRMLEHLLEQGAATTATAAGLGRRFQLAEIGDAGLDLATHRALADVVAGADGGGIRQGTGGQGWRAA